MFWAVCMFFEKNMNYVWLKYHIFFYLFFFENLVFVNMINLFSKISRLVIFKNLKIIHIYKNHVRITGYNVYWLTPVYKSCYTVEWQVLSEKKYDFFFIFPVLKKSGNMNFSKFINFFHNVFIFLIFPDFTFYF